MAAKGGRYFSKRRLDLRGLPFGGRGEALVRFVDEYADTLGRRACPVET
jgi:hypothetical protein